MAVPRHDAIGRLQDRAPRPMVHQPGGDPPPRDQPAHRDDRGGARGHRPVRPDHVERGGEIPGADGTAEPLVARRMVEGQGPEAIRADPPLEPSSGRRAQAAVAVVEHGERRGLDNVRCHGIEFLTPWRRLPMGNRKRTALTNRFGAPPPPDIPPEERRAAPCGPNVGGPFDVPTVRRASSAGYWPRVTSRHGRKTTNAGGHPDPARPHPTPRPRAPRGTPSGTLRRALAGSAR